MKLTPARYAVLKELNHSLILYSISGFGQTGPLREWRAYDPVIQSMSGIASVTGFPDRPPVRCGAAISDTVAPLFAVIGILAALRRREQTGAGDGRGGASATAVQRPHPVIFSAGASPAGRRFAARNADWMFIPGRMSRADATERIAQIREQCGLAGRPAHSVRFMRHVSMLVREIADEARHVSDWITSAIDLPAARAYVRSISQNISTYGDIYKQYAADDEVVRVIGVSSGAIRIHGSPRQVAEQSKELYDTQECRGIALTFPLWHIEEMTRFARLLLPILEEIGLWVSPHKRGWSW